MESDREKIDKNEFRCIPPLDSNTDTDIHIYVLTNTNMG
jgi:hypothetical protein